MASADKRIQVLIKAFGNCRDAQARRDFILDHPVMIHERVTSAICSGDTQRGVNYLLAIEVAGGKVQVQGQANISISFNADRYPVGSGPIEAVWASLVSRSISLEIAIEQVLTPRMGELLTYVYVKALCDKCDAQLRSGQWQVALPRQRLIVE